MGFRGDEVSEKAQEVKDAIKNPDSEEEEIIKVTPDMLISSGCTMLNLALSDNIDGAFILGSMVNLIGDSDVGKSLIAMSIMAEAVRDKRFDKYDLRYGNVEEGIHFPMHKMFGPNIDRVQFFPTKRPYTIQQWHSDMIKWTKKSVIHVTDSFDALTTDATIEKAEEGKLGKSFPEKAIISSAAWPTVIGQVEERKSLLPVISQTRDKINSLFSEKTRQGGWALKFFATCEVWYRKVGKITKKIRGKDFQIGDWVEAKVARTRITGKKRNIRFPVYYDYGIDDLESMIQWLVDMKFWETEKKKKSEVEEGEDKGKVIDTCGDFECTGKMETIIKYIEANNLERKLKEIVQECWNEIEDQLKMDRKPRYA